MYGVPGIDKPNRTDRPAAIGSNAKGFANDLAGNRAAQQGMAAPQPDIRYAFHGHFRAQRRRGQTKLASAAFGAAVVLVAHFWPGAMATVFAPLLPASGEGLTSPEPVSLTSSTGVYYSGCNEARAAGVAPIHEGQPGYRPEMDGDGDGIACEPHRLHRRP